MTTTRMRGAAVLAMLVATLAWAAWAVASALLEPGAAYELVSGAVGVSAEKALVVLASGAAVLGFEGLVRWAVRHPWRWQAAKLVAKAAFIAALAVVALAAASAAMVAAVGLAEQVWLMVEALAAEMGAPAPELAKVLVMGAASCWRSGARRSDAERGGAAEARWGRPHEVSPELLLESGARQGFFRIT